MGRFWAFLGVICPEIIHFRGFKNKILRFLRLFLRKNGLFFNPLRYQKRQQAYTKPRKPKTPTKKNTSRV